jgi:prepilin-type N-terminal cleavage/methylation domain-containing protein
MRLAHPARLVVSVSSASFESVEREGARVEGGPARRSLAIGRRRGFTLIELLISIIIIGLLAVMAIPSLSIASFDRDMYNDAGAIMQVFRRARTRAIARGSAVVVQMITTGNYSAGGFFTYEAVTGNPNGITGAQTPSATCKYPTTWAIASLVNIDGFAVNTASSSVDALAGIMAQPYVYTSGVTAGTTFSEGYICYTPLGRSYVTISPTVVGAPPLAASGLPVFSGLSSITALEMRVTRTNGATMRSVLLPNNGMARLFSHTI